MDEDIVKELRWADKTDNFKWDENIYSRAADEIEQLRYKIQNLHMYAERDACTIEQLQEELAVARKVIESWEARRG
jgi:predicted RNase H-like nuclease (RuvC/YqgF family)